MDPYRKKARSFLSSTATGTSSGATATLTGAASLKIIPTLISCSSDTAALVTVESPASTVIWQKRFAGAFAFDLGFPPAELEPKVAANTNCLVKISASTSNCEANIMGFTITAG